MFPTINTRVVVWAMLVVALLMNYITWLHDYPPIEPPPVAAASSAPGTAGVPGAAGQLGSAVPTVVAPTAMPAPAAAPTLGAAPVIARPAAPAAALATGATPAAMTTSAGTPAADQPAQLVHVRTDVLDLQISLEGGELSSADLLAYPEVKGESRRVRLLNRDSAASLYVLQSGLAGAAGDAAPTHLARFTSPVGLELTLAPGQDELRLPLAWSNPQGVTVTKTYVFHRGSYGIALAWQVQNGGSAPWAFAPYTQILRENEPISTSYFHPDTYDYKGPAYDDGKKYQKLKMDKEPPTLDSQVTGGWLAGLQHHFVAAIVPAADVPYHYQLQTQGHQFLFSATGPTQTVAPGAAAAVNAELFVGPKLQNQLKATSPRLNLVTDYGRLAVLAQPLFWVLDKVHTLFGNWGWTIIATTLLLKLLFYPLSEASMRSMGRMKALQPRIKALQETYKDERDKLGKAMMELYKKEKVNPVAGCLPMLIQFPVFIAFYWVLMGTVEMRQAPFAGWIGDLSARDPWFILPVLMMGANLINMRLNPQMGDPMQQKMMMVMQVGMPALFAFFPSGLVLYYVTNTVLSILQQWNINRRLAVQAAARN
jgi:YidC/Oxa1 family membrane protein insertase